MDVSSSAQAQTPLLAETPPPPHGRTTSAQRIKLYDPMVLLHMPTPVVEGYISLLDGGNNTTITSNSNNNSDTGLDGRNGLTTDGLDDATIQLSFAALTEGNVVEACLGVNAMVAVNSKVKTTATTTGMRLVKDAKAVLVELAESTDDDISLGNGRRLAVSTYRNAFGIVLDFHHAVQRLNCITSCLFYGRIQRKHIRQLEENFAELERKTAAAAALVLQQQQQQLQIEAVPAGNNN